MTQRELEPYSKRQQLVQSSSAEAATEEEVLTNVSTEMVSKFVMSQRRGAVEYSARNPTRQVFVLFGGRFGQWYSQSVGSTLW